MSVQPDLWGEVRGLARHGDPDTSRLAAEGISRSCEDAIRRVFAVPRDLTADDICALLPEWNPPTVKTAISRVVTDRFLVDSGARRPSARGRPSIVWQRAAE